MNCQYSFSFQQPLRFIQLCVGCFHSQVEIAFFVWQGPFLPVCLQLLKQRGSNPEGYQSIASIQKVIHSGGEGFEPSQADPECPNSLISTFSPLLFVSISYHRIMS